jgi:hypothetical protein
MQCESMICIMPISIKMGTWWLVRIRVKGNGMWWIWAILLLMRPTTPSTFVFSPLLSKIHYEKNRVICNWPYNMVSELQWPLATSLQLNIFLWHECYWTNCMNCSHWNSSYMEPYSYAICVFQLQLCMNNYCAISLQLLL